MDRINAALEGRLPLRDLRPSERTAVNDAIDRQIGDLVADTDYRARLLAEGVTIAYVDANQRIVEETPEGVVTVLHDRGDRA